MVNNAIVVRASTPGAEQEIYKIRFVKTRMALNAKTCG